MMTIIQAVVVLNECIRNNDGNHANPGRRKPLRNSFRAHHFLVPKDAPEPTDQNLGLDNAVAHPLAEVSNGENGRKHGQRQHEARRQGGQP